MKEYIPTISLKLAPYWKPSDSKYIDEDIKKEIEGKSIAINDVILLQIIKELKILNLK